MTVYVTHSALAGLQSQLVSVCAQAFDDLLLLKRGGHAIYVGHLGLHSADLVRYFEVRLLMYCLLNSQSPFRV